MEEQGKIYGLLAEFTEPEPLLRAALAGALERQGLTAAAPGGTRLMRRTSVATTAPLRRSRLNRAFGWLGECPHRSARLWMRRTLVYPDLSGGWCGPDMRS